MFSDGVVLESELLEPTLSKELRCPLVEIRRSSEVAVVFEDWSVLKFFNHHWTVTVPS